MHGTGVPVISGRLGAGPVVCVAAIILLSACGGAGGATTSTLTVEVLPSMATVTVAGGEGVNLTFIGSKTMVLAAGSYAMQASHEGYVTSSKEVELGIGSNLRVQLHLSVESEPVPESSPFESFEQVHVNVQDSAASDDNAGTMDAPLKTIAEGVRRAIDNRRHGLPTRVQVHSGVYRESITGAYGRDANGPLIVIEAVHEGGAVISGSDEWPSLACGLAICSADWTNKWGFSMNPWPVAPIEPLGLRREMVFVDGERLNQVLDYGSMASEPGSFFVDENAGKIHVHAPVGIDLRRAQVEVAVRPLLLELMGLNDLVISGIQFRHAASPMTSAAVHIVNQRDVMLHNVTVTQNNWNGVGLMGANFSVVNSHFNENGGSGIGAYQVDSLLLLDSETSGNNWRGYSGGYSDWSVGEKFIHVHNLVIQNHTANANLARGLWLDTDVKNAVIEGATLCANLLDGMFVEAVPGKVTIRNSTFCNNGRAGLLTSATHNLVFEDNHLFGNASTQINLSGDLRRTSTDFKTGETVSLRNEQWTWRGNVVTATGEQLLISTTLPAADWQHVMQASDLDYATYTSDRERAFRVPGGARVTFTDWKGLSGQDESSEFRLR